MKRSIFLLVYVSYLFIFSPNIYSQQNANVSEMQLSVHADEPNSPVKILKPFRIITHITNTGPNLVSFEVFTFGGSWITDNGNVSEVKTSVRANIIPLIRTILLKPGEVHEEYVLISINKTELETITFKLGFLSNPKATPIWSNEVTIKVAPDEEPIPVKIKASVENQSVQMGNSLPILVVITNDSEVNQGIGTELCGYCLRDLISDKPFIMTSCECRDNFYDPEKIILKPGESYEPHGTTERQGPMYLGINKDAPIGMTTFKVGIKPIGHQPTWSNPITIEILPKEISATNDKN